MLNECLTRNFDSMKEDLAFFKVFLLQIYLKIYLLVATVFFTVNKLTSLFQDAFDRQSALELGMILPRKGVDEEYDAACRNTDGCRTALQGYLSGVARRLKCTPKFVGTGRNAYQMELPDAVCRGIGDNFQLTSQRKVITG